MAKTKTLPRTKKCQYCSNEIPVKILAEADGFCPVCTMDIAGFHSAVLQLEEHEWKIHWDSEYDYLAAVGWLDHVCLNCQSETCACEPDDPFADITFSEALNLYYDRIPADIYDGLDLFETDMSCQVCYNKYTSACPPLVYLLWSAHIHDVSNEEFSIDYSFDGCINHITFDKAKPGVTKSVVFIDQ